MNDDENNVTGLSGAEEEVARRLARLGILMREQERSEADMDQVFARNLRGRLLSGEEGDLLLPRERSARPVPKPARRWIGAVAAAAVALLVALMIAVFFPRGAHVRTLNAPYPTCADLAFSFPAPLTAISRLLPTLSLVHPRPGIPFGGRLRLSAAHLPKTTPKLRAYRLAAPSNVATPGRRLLGIRSPIRSVLVASATWLVAADGGLPTHRRLHSLAVSLTTGEIIYHDRRNHMLPRATSAIARTGAIAVTRGWLTRLGWPGNRMPLQAIENVPNLPKVRAVEFGWIGVGTAATAAATLWVTPDRSVIEAWVWPPVVEQGPIPARAISTAWNDVRDGKLPLAVAGLRPTARGNGVGVLRRTTVVSVLSARKSGGLYLVPTYRFEGRVHIPGASFHAWYSLAPGAQR